MIQIHQCLPIRFLCLSTGFLESNYSEYMSTSSLSKSPIPCPDKKKTETLKKFQTGFVDEVLDNDVALCQKKVIGMNRQEILELFENIFRPDESFVFPKTYFGKVKRGCSISMLSSFHWVAYSQSCDGLFCIACTLFGHQFPSKNSRIDLLFKSPLRDWSSAQKRLQQHEGSHKTQSLSSFDGLHKYTINALSKLISDSKGTTVPVDEMINNQLSNLIKENRNKLKPIIQTVIFLGRNGLPFRGHRDASQYYSDILYYTDLLGRKGLDFLLNV